MANRSAHAAPRRALTALAVVAAVTVLAAACGGSGHSAAPAASDTVSAPGSTSSGTSPASAAATAAATASASPTGPYTPPSLAAPATTGALSIRADLAVPGSVSALGQIAVAEAPDGSVFLATAPGAPTTNTTAAATVVYVVDGDNPPVVAEHVPTGVVALAADDATLYVASETTITSYSRTTGAPIRSWPVALGTGSTPQPTALKLAAGRLWALTPSPARIVEITPAAAGVTTVVADATNVVGFAADASGIYYVKSGGQTLVHVTPADVATSAPTHQTVNLEFSGPSAVTPISVVDNTLVVVHDDGQGLDASLLTYNTRTLALLTSAGSNQANSNVVSTLAGPLVSTTQASNGCPAPSATAQESNCVARVVLATGVTTTALLLPSGDNDLPLALVGPYPAVVFSENGAVHLLRLG